MSLSRRCRDHVRASRSCPLKNEWGYPNVAEELEAFCAYDTMLNIKAQAYQPLLIESDLIDTQVAYWEPLKFAQRVRAVTTFNARHVMMKVEMDEGHTGAIDEYKDLRNRASRLPWRSSVLVKTPGSEGERMRLFWSVNHLGLWFIVSSGSSSNGICLNIEYQHAF